MLTVRSQKVRRGAALILLGILAVFSAASSVQSFNLARQQVSAAQPDGLTVWMGRMERVGRDLPAQGAIGYLSERDFSGLKFDPIDQDEEFAMTQYAIAPRILVEGGLLNYVIVNLPYLPVSEVARLMAEQNLGLVMEYGNGLYLGRKGSQ
jgi:hypothetical protein